MKNETEKLVCPICNAPTRVYMGNARKDRLCGKHADQFKRNEIIQCNECGKWHVTEETCSCKKTVYTELPTVGFKEDVISSQVEEVENAVIKIDEQNKSKCITCGRKVDGLLFCKFCYSKYKNKTLLVKITGASNVELLDESYEGIYTCKDGHIVKSKSERDIDNYLYEHRIQHAYERKISYGQGEREVLTPDFYLPNYLGEGKHVYIEHWGYNENNIKYTQTKKYKMQIYKKLCENKEMTLICTHEKSDMGDTDFTLGKKLKKTDIKEYEVNYE